MRAVIWGVGTVGLRVARQLLAEVDAEVVLGGSAESRLEAVSRALGERTWTATMPTPLEADVAVLCGPAGTHLEVARQFAGAGVAVVSVTDSLDDAKALLELAYPGVPLLVGCGFSPGLSCLLARHAAADFDQVDEVHLAKHGTGGPACARQHQRARREPALDWRDGEWIDRPSGSGRELVWFPDPIGAMDCYRAALAEPLLLVPAFAGVERVTARLAANRRNRLMARLPTLRRPPADGGPGAVRVEVRGRHGAGSLVKVLGAMDTPAVAAATVAATAARWVATGRVDRTTGGLATLVEPLPFLTDLHRAGVRGAVFEGSGE